VGEAGVADDAADSGWVSLPDAIESLRDDLAAAWWDGKRRRVRFRVEPVELTVQVGVTKSVEGSAGVKWQVLALGGKRSRDVASTQTLRLRLVPVLFDEKGNELPAGEQFISDRDDTPGATDEVSGERE
jgi:Trypsin-co-occurring domain 2